MKLEAVIAVICAVAFAGLLLFQTPGQFVTLLAGGLRLYTSKRMLRQPAAPATAPAASRP